MIGGCGGETRGGSSPPFGTITDEVKSAVEVSTDCKDNVIILSTWILPMPIRISGDVCFVSA